MAWPLAGLPWLDAVDVARATFSDIARQVSRFEPVTVVAAPWEAEEASLMCGPSVDVNVMPLNGWRPGDFGPSFLVDGEGHVATVAWHFNGFGNRVAHDLDQFFAEAVAETLEFPCFEGPLVLEGGSVLVDEDGTLLTTEKVLLAKSRNPTLSREQIEERLVFYLGARKILWLSEGMGSDVLTDGHLANVMALAPGGKALVHNPSGPFDPDAPSCDELRAALQRAERVGGHRFEVIDVPAPDPALDFTGAPAARSYVTFYLANNAVLVPAYDCPQDDDAAAIIGAAFPDRDVVQVEAGVLAYGGGSLRSVCLGQPKGKALPQV